MVKTGIFVLLVLVLSVFLLVGCTSSQTGYSSYNQPQQNQYAGGGCGVAPDAEYENTPVKAFDPNSGL